MNIITQAQSRRELRQQIAQLETKQREAAERELHESVWDALERLLPAEVLEVTRFEIDMREPRIREVDVTIDMQRHQCAPITFTLARGADDRPWALRTRRRWHDIWYDDGYRVGRSWRVEWDEYGDDGWYVQRSPLHDCDISTDLVEAVAYALDAWPVHDAACQQMMQKNEAGETPQRTRTPRPTPGQALLMALDSYIARHTEEEEY